MLKIFLSFLLHLFSILSLLLPGPFINTEQICSDVWIHSHLQAFCLSRTRSRTNTRTHSQLNVPPQMHTVICDSNVITSSCFNFFIYRWWCVKWPTWKISNTSHIQRVHTRNERFFQILTHKQHSQLNHKRKDGRFTHTSSKIKQAWHKNPSGIFWYSIPETI